MNARYYDPTIGRFLSEDPAGLGGGDLTLYSYASNNPWVFVDPSGLCSTNNWSASQGQKVIDAAYQFDGAPYKRGGSSLSGIDCSNLVNQAYKIAGHDYPYTSTSSWPPSQFVEIQKSELQTGDVRILPGHMGLYDPSGKNGDFYSATTGGGVRSGLSTWFKGAALETYWRYIGGN